MDDNNRTKRLAGALLAVVLVYFGRSVVDDWLFGPVRTLERGLKNSQDLNSVLADQEMELRRAENDLSEWTDFSLPENIDDAQRLYREWVLSLCHQCGLAGADFEVKPAARSDQKEYNLVAVEVSAETDLEGLARFLYLFDQVALMHRVTGLQIDSSGAKGNPRLKVSLTAEGLSVADSGNRPELFPRMTLQAYADESATTLKVALPESFPVPEDTDDAVPVYICINQEYLRVIGIGDGTVSVTRAALGSAAASHRSGDFAELFPVVYDRKDASIEDYRQLIARSPFVLPASPKTYSPRLAGLSGKTIEPGDEVRMTARAEGTDPALGEPEFSIVEAEDGVEIDAASGELVWKTPADIEEGAYQIRVQYIQTGAPETVISDDFAVTVQLPNEPPVLTVAESATVILGKEFRLQMTATDDGPTESLKFSLGGGAPEGLGVGTSTGQLTWTPSRTFVPGEYQVTVVVTDAASKPGSDSATITLDVQDDYSAYTLLSATVARDGKWFAWLRNKATGKTDKLPVGADFDVSNIGGIIETVDNRQMLFRDQAGLWKLELGWTLDQRKLVEAADPEKAAEDAAEDKAPEAAAADAEATAAVAETQTDAETTADPEPAVESVAPGDEQESAGAGKADSGDKAEI